jgi:V/A-type H+-transporting ATPase subunit D
MSLLRERGRVATAQRGVAILKSKRDGLLRELRRAAGEALEFRRTLGALATEATLALARARGLEGDAVLESLAAVSRRDVKVTLGVENVWGVRVPSIGSVPAVRRSADRGYGLAGTSAAADDAAAAHEALIAFVLENAPREIRLRRLAAELRRTGRKVNALEHEVIPRLLRSAERIRAALDEQERADRFRLSMMVREGPARKP